MASGGDVVINLRANDEASPAIERVRGKVLNFDDAVAKLPKNFTKASSALSMFGGDLAESGSGMEKVIGKVGKLSTMMAIGGPLGLAIGGATLAVGAASMAWEVHAQATKNAQAAQAAIASAFARVDVEITKHATKVAELAKQIEYFGKTANEIQISEAQKSVAVRQKQIASNDQMIAQLRAESSALDETIKKEEARNKALEESGVRGVMKANVAAMNQRAAALKQEITNLETVNAQNARNMAISQDEIGKIEEITRLKEAEKVVDQEQKEALRQGEEAAKRRAAASKAFVDRELQYQKVLTAEYFKQQKEVHVLADIMNKADAKGIQKRNLEMERAAEASFQRGHEAKMEAFAEEQQSQQDLYREYKSAADQMAGAFSQMGEAIIANEKNVGKYVMNTFLMIIERKVVGYATEAAAAAAAGMFSIPFIGPALAGAAAATAFGMVRAFAGKLVGMESGGEITRGMIRGGTLGRDSVPVLAQQGEGFLSQRDVRLIREFIASAGRSSGTVVINQHSGPFSPSSAETKRQAVEHARVLNDMARRGYRVA